MHPCLSRPVGTKRTACPVDSLMPRLGDKWTIHVVARLQEADNNQLRFSDLKRGIDGISQKMLTTVLRALERDGLVTRHVYPEVPPRVEYRLTNLGRELLPAMHAFMEWLEKSWPVIVKNRTVFDNPDVHTAV